VLIKEAPNTVVDRPESSGVALVVMGVSGSGKTTLAAQLSVAINAEFHDADDYHDEANIAKMREGVALTDEDRAPWLARLNALLRTRTSEGGSTVLACSALRASYRDAIANEIANLRWVFLDGEFETIAARIRARSADSDHYMPESLLRSQFDTLERPQNAIMIDASMPSDAQLACVLASLRA
jgi:gluconokinase